MNRNLIFIPALLVILSCAACTGKSSGQASGPQADTVAMSKAPSTATPIRVLLDTTETVKGYGTRRYTLPVGTDGTYTVTASSANTGLIFVIQDKDGNNVTEETPQWTGELKKGNYTLVVGLTRNAARDNEKKEVSYTVKAERE